MIILYIILGSLLWWGIGTIGLILDWIESFDLKWDDFFICLICGLLLGPFSLVFWLFSNLPTGKVLIKRRRK